MSSGIGIWRISVGSLRPRRRVPCDESAKPGLAVGHTRVPDRLDDRGLQHEPAVGDRRVAVGELQRRRRQQTLSDRELHVVADEVAAPLVLADHAALGVQPLEFRVGHGAVELERQLDAGVGAETEQLDLLLQNRLAIVRSSMICSPMR